MRMRVDGSSKCNTCVMKDNKPYMYDNNSLNHMYFNLDANYDDAQLNADDHGRFIHLSIWFRIVLHLAHRVSIIPSGDIT